MIDPIYSYGDYSERHNYWIRVFPSPNKVAGVQVVSNAFLVRSEVVALRDVLTSWLDEPKPAPAGDVSPSDARWDRVREDMSRVSRDVAEMDTRLRAAERTLARAEAIREHADTLEAAREADEEDTLKCACGHGWIVHADSHGCTDTSGFQPCSCARFTLPACRLHDWEACLCTDRGTS